jgi:hypothetical protein
LRQSLRIDNDNLMSLTGGDFDELTGKLWGWQSKAFSWKY